MESLGDVFVQLDIQIFIHCDIVISLFASLVDPRLELVSEAGEDDVTNVTTRHLPDLSDRWETIIDDLVGESVLQN
jgi:hypothetical protein